MNGDFSGKRKKILITGGAGFIGSHLCDYLLRDGHEVICLDNLVTGKVENLSMALKNPRFTFIAGDVCKCAELEVDLIFHLASPASPVHYSRMPVETLMANSVGTMRCLELAVKNEARMLFGSTSEVYGDPAVSPQPESYFGNVNPVGVRSCYDEGKRFSEALCKAFERTRGAKVVIVRIFNTYGTRMRKDDGRVIPNFVSQAISGRPLTVYGDGTQTRSFCHVSDMISGLVRAAFSDKTIGEVVNIGNPDEIRIIDLARMIIDMTNSNSKIVFEPLPEDDPAQRRPDITKALKILGWRPEIPLSSGLEEFIEWFKGQMCE